MGDDNIRADIVLALLAGGIAAAPVAPVLVRKLEPEVLGTIVGGFICMTNIRVVLNALGATQHAFIAIHVALSCAWAAAIANVLLQH